MRFWQHIKEMDGLLEEDSEAAFETEDSMKRPTDLKWLVVTLILSLLISNIAWVIATRDERSKPVAEPSTDIALISPDYWDNSMDINARREWVNAFAQFETLALQVHPIEVHCVSNMKGEPAQYIRDTKEIVVDTAWLSRTSLSETIYSICHEVYLGYCYEIEGNTCYVAPEDMGRNARNYASYQTTHYMSLWFYCTA